LCERIGLAVKIRIAGFRGNAFRQRGEASVVLRRINTDVPSIDGLKMPKILENLVMERNGLVLIVGATGSGKSTTLAAMIDHRNSNAGGHILTLEDPIEFVHSHKKSIVAQREIGTDTNSFSTGMKAAMRESPDVILMGEIRDLDSMEYALKFANTGHLALSTLHANNAISTMERVMGFFPRDARDAQAKRISQNLRAIVCQRLAPALDGGKVAVVEVLIKHLVRLYHEGKISEEVAFEYADSASNVKVQIRTANAGKTVGSLNNDSLSLSPIKEEEEEEELGNMLSI